MLQDIVEEHAEEASFLWAQRDAASLDIGYDLNELDELDERLEAHMDALRLAGDMAWHAAETVLAGSDPGEVFVSAYIAFASNRQDRIDSVVEKAIGEPILSIGLVSALGWLDYQYAQPFIVNLISATVPEQRYAGLAAASLHRRDPGAALLAALSDSEPAPRARAIRMAGEMGRVDLLPAIRRAYDADNDDVQFWALWSGALLGDENAAKALMPFCSTGPYALEALAVTMRTAALTNGAGFLMELAETGADPRHVLTGAAVVGDPSFVPGLIEAMGDSTLAPVAGNAIALITGVDAEHAGLETQLSVQTSGDDEDEDETVIPDPVLFQKWWQDNQPRFVDGQRYLAGYQINADNLITILNKARQPHRAAAALELAIAQPERELFETRARALFQKQRLQAG